MFKLNPTSFCTHEDFANTGVQTMFMLVTKFFTQDIEIRFSILELYSVRICYIQKKKRYAEVTL